MLDSIDFARLAAIGLSPRLLQNLHSIAPQGASDLPMRIVEVQREGLTLHDGNQEIRARALPALITRLLDLQDPLAVGDWVLVRHNDQREAWAVERVPPINQIARRHHDGRDKATRVVLVSNIDTALLVMGLDHDFNLRRLERYLALARLADVGAVVVLTKADLCSDVERRRREVEALLPPGVAVVCVNALGDEPAVALKPWLLPAQTLVLLGSSGAGKSTLTNALLGSHVQRTGASRADDSRGRHTTTTRTLHRMASGACIIDTPGLRTLRLDSEAGSLAGVFDDIATLSLQCRFRDCRHEAEPGCAVRSGVPAERLRNFHKLLRESSRDSQTALERKAQVGEWKARGRHAKIVARAKRG